MTNAWTQFRAALRLFRRARGGNVAITFAFATLPVIGAVGAAVDYSRANSVYTDLQAALDSTALMLSREAAKDTNTQLQANALSYFSANYNRPGTTINTVSATYTTTGGSQVVVNATVQVPTVFARVLGVDVVNVTGSSTAKWGMSRLRVALVLDNTGSMADAGKIDALKTATNNLLTQLKGAATQNGDVYVSIIPFVKDVNVGAANYKSNWIYWGTSAQDPSQKDNTSWEANNGTCSGYTGWGTPSDRATCISNNGNWKVAKHKTWNGCVMDRGYPQSPSSLGGKSGPDTINNYDTNVGSTDTTKLSSLYAAEQYSSCPQAAMGLSYDWTSMTSLVNNMQPAGNTNQAIGLQLGWMSLVGGGPFTSPAMDPNYTYQQVIILLTDGLNTQDRWYTSQSSIDTRQQMTCNNIKAAGITLYTIQVNTDGDPTSTLLQNCASSSDKFFLLTSSNQIVTTFQQIGTNLSKLYVAK
ncbi:MAG TPA: pilus assembly protein [Pseudolabrys sp.]|nr:pilus assembly protein [Pseudolabrys sp.]